MEGKEEDVRLGANKFSEHQWPTAVDGGSCNGCSGYERLLLAPPIVGSATQARMATGAADGLRIRQIPSR